MQRPVTLQVLVVGLDEPAHCAQRDGRAHDGIPRVIGRLACTGRCDALYAVPTLDTAGSNLVLAHTCVRVLDVFKVFGCEVEVVNEDRQVKFRHLRLLVKKVPVQ